MGETRTITEATTTSGLITQRIRALDPTPEKTQLSSRDLVVACSLIATPTKNTEPPTLDQGATTRFFGSARRQT